MTNCLRLIETVSIEVSALSVLLTIIIVILMYSVRLPVFGLISIDQRHLQYLYFTILLRMFSQSIQ